MRRGSQKVIASDWVTDWSQRNEEGAAQIFFRTPEEADLCIEKLHGRWFAGQKITAETWDGNTKYRYAITESLIELVLLFSYGFMSSSDAQLKYLRGPRIT